MTAEADRRVSIQQAFGADQLASLSSVRDEVVQMRELVRSLAANADLFADNRTRCQTTMESLGPQYPDATVLSVIDSQSRVLCADRPALVGSEPNTDTLAAAAEQRGEAVIGVTDDALPSFVAIAPAQRGGENETLFVSVARAVSPMLSRMIHPAGGATLIVDGQGRVVFGNAGPSMERIARALERNPPATLTGAQRLGDQWLIVAPLETNALYLVDVWTPAPPSFLERVRSAWTLLAPIFLWLAAVAAAWYAIEIFVARPLFVVERLARAYARGEDNEGDEEILRDAPLEMRNLRRTLAAMAKTLRGREARITEALQEERVLLREVHHRVKNNLQMVASILSIQARASEDEAEARGLARAKDRVQMLALAHSRIYASGEVRDIALDQLAGDVARQLVAGRGAAAAHLRLDMKLDPVRTDVDRAVAFAFLIGEGLSNAIDVALAGGGQLITMTLRVDSDGSLSFEVSCPEVTADKPAGPAAHRLVDAFAQQLGARVIREPGDPVFTRIVVPPETETVPA